MASQNQDVLDKGSGSITNNRPTTRTPLSILGAPFPLRLLRQTFVKPITVPPSQINAVPTGTSSSSSHPHNGLPQGPSLQPIEDDSTGGQHTSTVREDIPYHPRQFGSPNSDTAHGPIDERHRLSGIQKQLPLSPEQRAVLMSINSGGRSLNCKVEILQIDRLKWAALNEKKPQLLQTIRDKYSISLLYTNGHLTVQEDNPQGRGNMAAIAEIEQQLSKCNTCPLKTSFSSSLLASLKFKLNKDSPNSIVFQHEGLQYLCSELDTENAKILEMVEHKTIVKFVNANAKIIKTVKEDHRLHEKAFERVEVFFQERRIAIKGFVLKDVLAAKEMFLDIVGQMKVTKRMLSCSLPIKAYIHHILFEKKMSAKHRTLLSSLSVKVITEDNTVYLEGSPGAIKSEEKKLISELVPETFVCEECEFSCNRKFIPQIEKYFLSPLHKQYKFTHLISCYSSEAADKDRKYHYKKARHNDRTSRPSPCNGDIKKRNQSESEDIGFTIMLFSTQAQQFEEVVSSIKELNPQTVRLQVPRGSIEYLRKKKFFLESKYCLWIFFSPPKGNCAMVTLHGLRDCDVIECREDMEQSVFVTKRYYLDSHALLYLRKRCQNSIEELKNKCKTVSLPPEENDVHIATACSKNPYILIKGKEVDVNCVMKKLDLLVGPEHFKVEMVSFNCLQCLAKYWKAWIEQIPTEDALVNVTLCQGPNSTAGTSKNALFSIEVLGTINSVDKIVVRIVKEKQKANHIQCDLEVSSQNRIQVQDLVQDAGIGDLKVWLGIRENKVLILAPSFAQDDLRKAKSLIEVYFEESSGKVETVCCQSKLSLDIMLVDEVARFLDEVGKKNQVKIQIDSAECTIKLLGTQLGLDKVKPLVLKAILMVQQKISSKKIPVMPIQSPCLESKSFKEFCQEMRKNYQVEIVVDQSCKNRVLTKACVGPLTGQFPRKQVTQCNVEWCYKGDSYQWEPYLPNDSAQLEAWYKSHDLQPTESLQIGKFKYKFNLDQMTQTNTRTKKVREIKRSVKISTENADSDDSSEGQAKWYFRNDLMEFQPYESSDSTQLEKWYQLSPSTPPGQLTIFGNVYSFNFSSMEQMNIETGKTREIKREGDDVKHESKTLKIQGNTKHIDYVMMQVRSKLDNCLSEKLLDVPEPVKIQRIQKITQKYPVKLDTVAPAKVKICGVQHVLQRCIDEIKTEMIASLQVASTSVPQEWEQQKETVEYSVSMHGPEWNKVSTKFMETLTSVLILKIERIQNRLLWEKYSQHKKWLDKKNKGNVNEEFLFHGTGSNDPAQIYSSDEGFDMRFCNKGMWGLANYFAVNSSYSNSYAYQDSSGNKQMFLAYVLTGDSYECDPDHTLKMPPEKRSKLTYAQQTAGEVNLKQLHYDTVSGHTNGSKVFMTAGEVNLKQLHYDTVSGHTNGSKVFMTYDNHKAYPAYLITYQQFPNY